MMPSGTEDTELLLKLWSDEHASIRCGFADESGDRAMFWGRIGRFPDGSWTVEGPRVLVSLHDLVGAVVRYGEPPDSLSRSVTVGRFIRGLELAWPSGDRCGLWEFD